MSGTAGIRKFAEDLRRLPRVVAQKVTAAAAPVLTELAQSTFDASSTPYGVSWTPGAEGQRVTLSKSGALARQLRYVAIGTRLRVALGVAYAKYQIGKRPVFPGQNALPPDYLEALGRTALAVVRAELGR